MTDPKPGSGLRGIWGAEYEEIWAAKMAPFFDRIRHYPVAVLLWGPGDHQEAFAKRAAIGAAIGELPATSVATSEGLIAADERFSMFDGDPWPAEQAQVQAADIVIALVVEGPQGDGTLHELTFMRALPDLNAKVHIVYPVGYRGSRGIAKAAAKAVPAQRRFDYTPEQLLDCQEIRATARRWVEDRRQSLFVAEAESRGLPR